MTFSNKLLALLAALLSIGFTGCSISPPGVAGGERAISPAEPSAASPGLGPGVRPLSYGPGDKSSPRYGPSGDRVAFTVDGYVVEKPLYAQSFERKTTKDFKVERVEWISAGNGLALLTPAAGDAPRDVYQASLAGNPLVVRRMIEDTWALGAAPGGGAVVSAVRDDSAGRGTPERSRLVLGTGLAPPRSYANPIEGMATGISISSTGSEAILSIQARGRSSIYVYRFTMERARRLTTLPQPARIIGAPQWTTRGIYYVMAESGTQETSGAAGVTRYTLYRVSRTGMGSDEAGPERILSIGEDFVAAGIAVSPDGQRLAVVGRRTPDSPTDLYLLDLRTGEFRALTSNENMEIKTNPADLSWSPDGNSIAIVARTIPSELEIYGGSLNSQLGSFYNVYEVRAENSGGVRE